MNMPKKIWRYLKQGFLEFLDDTDGMGVVEIILIIVVLISLVVIFKDQITKVVNNIMKSITKSSKSIYGS